MMLGQMPGSQFIPMIVDAATPAPVPDCSTWDFFFNAPAWQACQVAKEKAQIATVPANAAYYYGPGSVSAQVAQQAAAQQAAQAEGDQANIANYYGAGTVVATPGQGMPTWVIAALLVGGVLLVKNMNS
jgi:uncharacterized protein YfaS (alpha-2-macroglobulin family)